MSFLTLLLSGLVAGQGEAVLLQYPHEPGVVSGSVSWSGRTVPLVRAGETWHGVIGVDLDAAAGAQAAEVTLVYEGGEERRETQPIEVRAKSFPTTELTVAPKYVEPNPEDQARAERESREIAAIYARLDPERYWSAPFEVPVRGVSGGRNFGHRRVFNGQPRAPHSGADLRAGTGTPIHASNRGRVVLAKDLFFSGNAVFIDHGLGVYSTYLHLSEIHVTPGTIVEKGQVIGLAGATGRVTGPHLHWGVRILDARVDPFSLLALPSSPGQ
jgi:murein DD-endopeptidase MepM/ murein hydrolase activator NlpD